jgi:hypothetical protein
MTIWNYPEAMQIMGKFVKQMCVIQLYDGLLFYTQLSRRYLLHESIILDKYVKRIHLQPTFANLLKKFTKF